MPLWREEFINEITNKYSLQQFADQDLPRTLNTEKKKNLT